MMKAAWFGLATGLAACAHGNAGDVDAGADTTIVTIDAPFYSRSEPSRRYAASLSVGPDSLDEPDRTSTLTVGFTTA